MRCLTRDGGSDSSSEGSDDEEDFEGAGLAPESPKSSPDSPKMPVMDPPFQPARRAKTLFLDEGESSSKTPIMDWFYPMSAGKGGKVASGTPKLEALDAPRWIASIQIVGYHFYLRTEQVGMWGACWTQFFFMLSGFVLAYAEMARPVPPSGTKASLLSYLRKRMIVIYPSYMLAIILQSFGNPAGARTPFEWFCLPLHLTMLQSWFPICMRIPEGRLHAGAVQCSPWLFNGVSWFISVLAFYWLTLRPLARKIRFWSLKVSWAVLFICWALCIAFQFIGENFGVPSKGSVGVPMFQWDRHWSVRDHAVAIAIRATPIGYFHTFLAGIIAARIFVLTSTCDAKTQGPVTDETKSLALDLAKAPCPLRYGCMLGYFLYALLPTFVDINPIYYAAHNGGTVPIMFLVLLGSAIGTDPITVWIFRNQIFLTLGRISYIQYLMQFLTFGFLMRNVNPHYVKQVFVPFLLTWAFFCQRWYETPFTEWQRWREKEGAKGVVELVIDYFDNNSEKKTRKLGWVMLLLCQLFGTLLIIYFSDATRTTYSAAGQSSNVTTA